MTFVEIPVTLKLKKNVAEVARILAKCYDGPSKEDFDNFISGEVSKIIFSLAENPPEPPCFPDSLKQHLKDLLLLSKSSFEDNDDDDGYNKQTQL